MSRLLKSLEIGNGRNFPLLNTKNGEAFEQKGVLNKGVITPFNMKKSFHCIFCNEAFSDVASLAAHWQIHKSLSCTYCGRTFNRSSTLKEHMRTHSTERAFLCTACNLAFKSHDKLIRHNRTVSHARMKKTIANAELNNGKTFCCKVCNFGYKYKHDFEAHNLSVHGVNNGRPFVCRTCNKSFTNSNNLKQHSVVHSNEKPFICTLCNSGFKRLESLGNHFSTCVVKVEKSLIRKEAIDDSAAETRNKQNAPRRSLRLKDKRSKSTAARVQAEVGVSVTESFERSSTIRERAERSEWKSCSALSMRNSFKSTVSDVTKHTLERTLDTRRDTSQSVRKSEAILANKRARVSGNRDLSVDDRHGNGRYVLCQNVFASESFLSEHIKNTHYYVSKNEPSLAGMQEMQRLLGETLTIRHIKQEKLELETSNEKRITREEDAQPTSGKKRGHSKKEFGFRGFRGFEVDGGTPKREMRPPLRRKVTAEVQKSEKLARRTLTSDSRMKREKVELKATNGKNIASVGGAQSTSSDRRSHSCEEFGFRGFKVDPRTRESKKIPRKVNQMAQPKRSAKKKNVSKKSVASNKIKTEPVQCKSRPQTKASTKTKKKKLLQKLMEKILSRQAQASKMKKLKARGKQKKRQSWNVETLENQRMKRLSFVVVETLRQSKFDEMRGSNEISESAKVVTRKRCLKNELVSRRGLKLKMEQGSHQPRQYHRKGNVWHECGFCGMKFENLLIMASHISAIHSVNFFVHACPITCAHRA